MAKKRGLASNRGLDALLGSIKTEKLIAGNLAASPIVTPNSAPTETNHAPTTELLASPEVTDANANTGQHTDEHPTIASLNSQTQTTDFTQYLQDLNAHRLASEPSSTLPTAKQAVAQPNAVPKPLHDHNTADTSIDSTINLLHIGVERLQRGKYQPRLDLGEDTLQELATSIRQHGVMQPIVIRPLLKPEPDSPVTHEIIAGERRWRAAQIAGLSHIPAIVRPISDDLAIALALIENIQREDLSVMEQAVALQRFHDEFGMSHAQIADVVGKARTTVSNLLRLNQLHEEVKTLLNDGQLDMGHARALLAISVEQQPQIAKKIANEQLTVRQTEQLIKQILDPKANTPKTQPLDFERLRLNQQLSERLGAVVKVKGSSAGKGSIEIFFHNADELQALLNQLQPATE